MPIIAECVRSGQCFHVKKGTVYPCPRCEDGVLESFDHCRRFLKYEGGNRDEFFIPRGRCTNDGCSCTLRMLPPEFAHFKHYAVGVIEDVLDGNVIPDNNESETYPCSQTMYNWLMWFNLNLNYIEAMIRSILNRRLGFSDDILTDGMSVIRWAHKTDKEMWLSVIQRYILNSGGMLQPI